MADIDQSAQKIAASLEAGQENDVHIGSDVTITNQNHQFSANWDFRISKR